MDDKTTDQWPLWVKAAVTGLVRYKPSGVYFTRAKAGGKLIGNYLGAQDRILQTLDFLAFFLACYRCSYILPPMNDPITPQTLLEQILQIRRMEHGSLSVIGHGPNGPYHNLNSWEKGANHCRYVPRDKVPEVQQAIEGYEQYQQLTQQYGQQVVEQTRAELGIGVKKKPRPNPNSPRPKSSSWPKTRKSSS
jgi:hypothetical protein